MAHPDPKNINLSKLEELTDGERVNYSRFVTASFVKKVPLDQLPTLFKLIPVNFDTCRSALYDLALELGHIQDKSTTGKCGCKHGFRAGTEMLRDTVGHFYEFVSRPFNRHLHL